MADKKIFTKENAASPEDPKGPGGPGVKIDAGEDHHLKQAAASLNEPEEMASADNGQTGAQPPDHDNDRAKENKNAGETPDVPDDYVRVAGRREMQMPPEKWDRVDEESDESFPASDPPGNY